MQHGHHQPRVNVVDDGEGEADRPFFLLVGITVHLCAECFETNIAAHTSRSEQRPTLIGMVTLLVHPTQAFSLGTRTLAQGSLSRKYMSFYGSCLWVCCNQLSENNKRFHPMVNDMDG